MNKSLFLVLIPVLLSASIINNSFFQDKANFLCSQLIPKPEFDYDTHFEKSFQQFISYDQLIEVFKQRAAEDGPCRSAEIVKINGQRANLKLKTHANAHKVQLELNSEGKITTLFFAGLLNPKEQILNETELQNKLLAFGPVTGLTLKNLSQDKDVITINNKKRLGIASEFKLYVLNQLAEEVFLGKHNWSDTHPLQESLKSLPSGILQDEEAGTEITIQKYAELMIAISDNTATDHLIELVGRKGIEASLPLVNSFVTNNIPFMSSTDLFRAKTLSADAASAFAKASSNEKAKTLAILKEKYADRNLLINDLKDWDSPRHITTLEWFANTDDMCSVMNELRFKGQIDQTVLDILSVSHPFKGSDADSYFDYVGYKGGSEPGVLTMTFLLKTKKQEWACLSLAINDEVKNLDQAQVVNFYHSVLIYAGKLLE